MATIISVSSTIFAAGTGDGFAYRMVYLDPALVEEALGGAALPFVADPVVDTPRLPKDFSETIWQFDRDLDEAARIDLVVVAADLLVDAANERRQKSVPLAVEGLHRARDLIAARPAERLPMQALERASGLDRWTLARQFRAAFGTSPSRFRTMRRLDRVRCLLRAGAPLAQAALEAGFADQSHMSRQFKAAYGLTPGDWVSIVVPEAGARPPTARQRRGG